MGFFDNLKMAAKKPLNPYKCGVYSGFILLNFIAFMMQ